MESPAPPDHATARALLDWHIEAGADEAIGDVPIDRYTLDPAPPKAAVALETKSAFPAPAPGPTDADVVAAAEEMAAGAGSLEDLAAAMQTFPYCALRRGARNLVFADGLPGAHVMIVGEAPDRDEDRDGRPFAGRTGDLLDRMLAAIGLSRQAHDPASAVYLANVLPWRAPTVPNADDIAMMRPFLVRHIALAAPAVVVLMGNAACQALLGETGITRLRGHWAEVAGVPAVPALPMFHPAHLLDRTEAKREAWADLLALRAHLNEHQT